MTEFELQPTNRSAMRNPSYPKRIHLRERGHWQGVLKSWEERIEAARQQLGPSGGDPERRRLFVQMLGARDQLAEAAGRLPMETGDLYAGDRERLENAVAALERVFARWG